MRQLFLILCLLFSLESLAQYDSALFRPDLVFALLPNHPIARIADLQNVESQMIRLQAKGLFDPKFEFDQNAKEFDGTDYYQLQKAGLTVATWPGIDFKAAYKTSSGEFLNPQASLPENGMIEMGADANLLRGLLFDSRRAALQEAKAFALANEAERRMALNKLASDAMSSYWHWAAAYGKFRLVDRSLQNALERYDAIRSSYFAGSVAAIDTVEALTLVQNRRMDKEKMKYELTKNRLLLSSYLWGADSLPLRLAELSYPIEITQWEQSFFERDSLESIIRNLDEFQPELLSISADLVRLDAGRKLALNNLLPEAKASYRWLNPGDQSFNSEEFNPTSNYTLGLSVNIPLFLRKERAYLRLNQLKRTEQNLKLLDKRNTLINKLDAHFEGLLLYRKNSLTAEQNFKNYTQLFEVETRKFRIGESTLFLINSRESSQLNSGIKWIEQLESFEIQKLTLLEEAGLLLQE